jgi:hypothetical protein
MVNVSVYIQSILCTIFLWLYAAQGLEDGDEEWSQPRMVVDDEDSASRDKRRIVNFASESAGAVVLDGSQKFQGKSNLLNDHKDKYAMIESTEEKKWVTIGISEDVKKSLYL